MIVTAEDLAAAERAVEADADFALRLRLGTLAKAAYADALRASADALETDVLQMAHLLAQAPHLAMPVGFDEHIVLDRPSYEWPAEAVDRLRSTYGFHGPLMFQSESLFRHRKSGAWYLFSHVMPGELLFVGDEREVICGTEWWLTRLRELTQAPDPDTHVLWLPRLWTPRDQAATRAHLKETIEPILLDLKAGKRELRDVHWRELEELVAELLASRGLQISVTAPRGDGGRDIVARGELVPGEPMEIAVEVKQKAVVGLTDVQRALRANEDFPALMVATAGRFSAGVIREKSRHRNQLRLFLKDGIALTQWITTYRADQQRS